MALLGGANLLFDVVEKRVEKSRYASHRQIGWR